MTHPEVRGLPESVPQAAAFTSSCPLDKWASRTLAPNALWEALWAGEAVSWAYYGLATTQDPEADFHWRKSLPRHPRVAPLRSTCESRAFHTLLNAINLAGPIHERT